MPPGAAKLGLAAGLLACSTLAFAQDTIDPEQSLQKRKIEISYEANADYSFVGGARTNLRDGRHVEVSEQSGSARFVVSPRIVDRVLMRLGIDWERRSFDLERDAALPKTLQSASVVIGADIQLFDALLLRVEAEPGFYGSRDFATRDFNVPFIIGGTYFMSADVQWVLGLSVDFNRRYPVLPGIGLRWKFAEKWTLNAILPNPRIEYQVERTLVGFAGVNLIESTYRVSDGFGDGNRAPRLNGAFVDYFEVRVGAGAEWKLSRSVTIDLEAGYMPYREFYFHRAGINVKTESGAAYGQVVLTSHF